MSHTIPLSRKYLDCCKLHHRGGALRQWRSSALWLKSSSVGAVARESDTQDIAFDAVLNWETGAAATLSDCVFVV